MRRIQRYNGNKSRTKKKKKKKRTREEDKNKTKNISQLKSKHIQLNMMRKKLLKHTMLL